MNLSVKPHGTRVSGDVKLLSRDCYCFISFTATSWANYWAPSERSTTSGTPCPTLFEQCLGSFTSRRVVNFEALRDGAYRLSSLPIRLKFYSLIQWPWVLARPGYEPPTSPHGGASPNRLNQPVFTTEFWRGKMRGLGDEADYNECLVKL